MLVNDPLYPSDLTNEEAVAGFVKCEIVPPNPIGYSSQKTIMAVVYECGPSHRLIKTWDPAWNKIAYKLLHYGVFKGAPDYEKPDWLPVGAEVEGDPNTAVETAMRKVREPTGHEIVSHIPPKMERTI